MLIFFSIYFCSNVNANSCLTLPQYLDQVRHHNVGLAGNRLLAIGTKLRACESSLAMQPTFFAEGQYLKNTANPNWALTTGNGLQSYQSQSYRAGIAENTPYGINGKLYYNYQNQRATDISPLGLNRVTTSSPVIEMDVPLSRNFGGKETRASALLATSSTGQMHYSERFKINQFMLEAESTYWHLATIREILSKQKQAFDRAVQIYEWTEKRQQKNLAEEADLLQARANVNLKELDLQATINNKKLISQHFNTLRGSANSEVCEKIKLPTCFNHIILPGQPGLREDVLAAEQEQNFAIANALLGIEKNKPELELYASYALNGHDSSSNEAVTQSFSFNYPTTAVGLRLSMPLNVCQLKKDRLGYRKEIRGAKYLFQQKIYENNRLWQEITLKIRNAQDRLAIATQLEQIQLKKLENEQQRLRNGRTTTYQVLLFEQEYTHTQIASLEIKDEILTLLAELKTFGATNS